MTKESAKTSLRHAAVRLPRYKIVVAIKNRTIVCGTALIHWNQARYKRDRNTYRAIFTIDSIYTCISNIS